MAIILFFGYSLFIFLVGAVVVGLTFHHWYKLAKEARRQKKLAETTR
jgi:hypothetical protein